MLDTSKKFELLKTTLGDSMMDNISAVQVQGAVDQCKDKAVLAAVADERCMMEGPRDEEELAQIISITRERLKSLYCKINRYW